MEPTPPSPRLPQSRTSLILYYILLLLALATLVVAGIRLRPAAVTAPHHQPHSLAPARVELRQFATGLPHPTAIVSTNQPGDDRLFVLDQSGLIRIVGPTGAVLPTPFLDLSAQVLFSGEMGLLGLAFSPHYAQDGYFFINYVDKGQNTILARYHIGSKPDQADPASGQTLLQLQQPYPNHNGGDLAFGPDGYLYATLGDGGNQGDPQNRAQNLSILFGKILRLDVGQIPYRIPPTNPFTGQAGKAAEIWDYGLCNPWRISFDRQTHQLYIADVGQGRVEEVNVEAAGSGGHNYGWRCYEGSPTYNAAGCQPPGQYVFPVLEYDHGQNRCSITGGYVYRGQQYPALVGRYFYGDYCGGQLYWTQQQKGVWNGDLALATPAKISAFGQDGHGELYLADYQSGNLYRLIDAAN